MISDDNHLPNDPIELFEEAWQETSPPNLSSHLQPLLSGQSRVEEAKEILKIDLEYRWRKAPPMVRRIVRQPDDEGEPIGWCPQARDYFVLFPDVFQAESDRRELVVEEYRIRRRWGDDPPMQTVVDGYPDLAATAIHDLRAVDEELASRKSFVASSYQATVSSALDKKSLDDVKVGDRLDDFQLLKLLGRGAFAKVFFAQQISMQRLVALKVSEQKSGESILLAQLDHPNIVRVYDQKSAHRLHLVYMQYVEGGSLRDWLDRFANKYSHEEKESWVARFGAGIAAALEHAHDKGILHRDIKPENVLLQSDTRPMLADFNLSYAEESTLQAGHQKFGGTLDFMSPEQLDVLIGKRHPSEVDSTSDVYSLAVMLHLLLNGTHPFVSRSGLSESDGVLERSEARRRFSESAGQKSEVGSLQSIINQCLAFDRELRPQGAAEVRRLLERCRFRELRNLLSGSGGPWISRFQSYPALSMLLTGLIPSAIMSPLNIWANHTIAIDGFNREFFHRIEEPAVNAILFPFGVLVGWWLLRPIRGKDREKAASCALRFPWMAFYLVLTIWAISGLIFPLWNIWGGGGKLGLSDIFGFFVSQFLHGVLAAASALVLVSSVSLRSVYYRLIDSNENVSEVRLLTQLDRYLILARSLLQVTPLFALLAIAVSAQLNRFIFLNLALVGFVGHIVASDLVPRLKQWIAWYQLGLAPTAELTKHE